VISGGRALGRGLEGSKGAQKEALGRVPKSMFIIPCIGFWGLIEDPVGGRLGPL